MIVILLTYNSPMRSLPKEIYLAKHVRELDRIAIEEFKVPGFTLMQNAGAAAFEVIQEVWPNAQHIIVLAGAGNNGGDGYVIARLALEANKQVETIQVGDHTKLVGDAKTAHDLYVEKYGHCSKFNMQSIPDCDLIIDAMLGTGLTRTVKGNFETAIRLINEHNAPVLSADIPSGLDANYGAPLGIAVVADATTTFVGMKLGLVTGAGRKFSGKVYFNDLQIPKEVYTSMTAACHNITLENFYSLLPPREADAHKGDFGHLLLIGGSPGYEGSVMLAAEAAARVGCGLSQQRVNMP